MKETSQDSSTSLRREADVLLKEKGLLEILRVYGRPHVHGSYALDLMTWRDLDIYLESEDLSEHWFFELGGRLATALVPTRMNFRNERIERTPDLPSGFYWGIYLSLSEAQSWKVDVWAIQSAECAALLARERHMAGKLSAANRPIILKIKKACWKHSEYRRGFSSADIYHAVLEEHVATFAQFREYIKARKGIIV
jgi:hypothetical protein